MNDENADAMALAEAMLNAIGKVAHGQPQVRIALALTWACGAMVQTCARPGQEASALRAAAAHMLVCVQKVEAKGLQVPLQ